VRTSSKRKPESPAAPPRVLLAIDSLKRAASCPFEANPGAAYWIEDLNPILPDGSFLR
jgi:hypothetical protein